MVREMIFVFRDNQLIKTFEKRSALKNSELVILPNDVFISFFDLYGVRKWFRKDLTPVYKDDIPESLKAALQIELLLLT